MAKRYSYTAPGRPDYERIRVGRVLTGDYTEIEYDGTVRHVGEATVWDDLRFPVIGQQLDTSAGRIDYNYADLTVDYQDNARYPEEFIGIIAQLPHGRKPQSDIRPHLHWLQNQDETPNILVAWRWYNNGDIVPSEYELTPVTFEHTVFPYTSETAEELLQITSIPTPVGIGATKGLSSIIDIKIYRDTQNTSTLFAGADAYVGNWSLKEFDIHIEYDTDGSRQEFIK